MTINRSEGTSAGGKRLMFAAMAASTVTVIAIISTLALYNDRMMTQTKAVETEQLLDSQGQAVAWGVETWLRGQIRLTDIAHNSISNLNSSEDPFSVLGQPTLRKSFFHAMYGDNKGGFTISPRRVMPEGYDPRARPWYQTAADARGMVITDPYSSASTGRTILTIARPVIENGDVKGVVGNDVLVDTIFSLMAETNVDGLESVFLINNEGQVLVHQDEQIIGTNIQDLFDQGALVFSNDIQYLDSQSETKIIKFIAVSNIPEIEWRVGLMMDKKTVYAGVNTFRRSIVIALAAATLLMMLAVGFVTHALLVKPLMKAHQKAQQASIAKSEFLASMSHEIRTPMNGVLGMSELLQNTTLNEKQKTFVDTIYKSGSALLTIINDILDFSKIEAGKLELDCSPFNIRTAMEDVAMLLGCGAREKGIELVVRHHPGTPSQVIGDAGRIRQAVTNLVGNAIKFTHEGYVLLDITCVDVGDTAKIKISIEDTGIGIPKEKLNSIFEEFTQAESSTTRKYGGTGLGLSITRSLIHAMGGDINVTSTHGKGSVFSFIIELPVADGDVDEFSGASADLTGKKLLIVDDFAVNRQILEEQLLHWRASPSAAESGEEALALLRQAAMDGSPYDAALIDYHMPEMDGAELAKHIKTDPTIAETPILVLSSVDDDSVASTFRQYGVTEFLTKPARTHLLLTSIGRLVVGKDIKKLKAMAKTSCTDQDGSEVNKNEAAAKQCSILVAEDNNVNQLVIKHMISSEHFNLTFAENGLIAYKAYQKQNFDLVLMDISMPEMDGIEALKAIRAFEAKNDAAPTPVIAITAHAMEGDQERLLETGFDDYLSKPLEKAGVDAILNKWASNNENHALSA